MEHRTRVHFLRSETRLQFPSLVINNILSMIQNEAYETKNKVFQLTGQKDISPLFLLMKFLKPYFKYINGGKLAFHIL
jgi:hypothetical protein